MSDTRRNGNVDYIARGLAIQRTTLPSGESISDFLNSIIRLGEDIPVTGDVVLGLTAFGRIHDVTEPCNINLINPGPATMLNNVIDIRIADDCPGLVKITGPIVYNPTTVVMWAGEEIAFEWTGTHYRTRSTTRKGFHGTLARNTGNVALALNTWADFIVDTPSGDRDAYNLCVINGGNPAVVADLATYTLYYDAVNGRFKAPRDGYYEIEWFLSVTCSAASILSLTMAKNGETQSLEWFKEINLSVTARQGHSIKRVEYMAEGNYIIPRARLTSTTGAIDIAVAGHIVVKELL